MDQDAEQPASSPESSIELVRRARAGDRRAIELVRRARAGDRRALGTLFQRHVPPLRRWASGRLPRRVSMARGSRHRGET
jgi:hypothetical protein